MGVFQVVGDPEIPCIDADDLLPDGTARLTLLMRLLILDVGELVLLSCLGSSSVPGFVVLLAPLQPSSCGFSGSPWVDDSWSLES